MQQEVKDKIRKEIIAFYYEIEGGKFVSDHEDDLGGLTGAGGITMVLLEEFKHLWDKHGFTGDIACIPYNLIEEIYTLRFWNRMWLDKIVEHSEDLADTMFGWAMNSGTGSVVEAFQKYLNGMNLKGELYDELEDIDGGMGRLTFTAFERYLEARSNADPLNKILSVMISYQEVHYVEIAHKRKSQRNDTFLNGWLNRVQKKRERLFA